MSVNGMVPRPRKATLRRTLLGKCASPSPAWFGTTGSSSPKELLMTCSTSDVAVCCSSAGFARTRFEFLLQLRSGFLNGVNMSSGVRSRRTKTDTVLHQCIRPRVGALAPDHHGNPRAPDLISGHASKGYSGHQFSDALERPFLHLFYFSRRPRRENDRGAYIAFLLVVSSSLI
jgi:hypothetical protein